MKTCSYVTGMQGYVLGIKIDKDNLVLCMLVQSYFVKNLQGKITGLCDYDRLRKHLAKLRRTC
jgi:hypothetical protein